MFVLFTVFEAYNGILHVKPCRGRMGYGSKYSQNKPIMFL